MLVRQANDVRIINLVVSMRNQVNFRCAPEVGEEAYEVKYEYVNLT